MKLAKRDLDLIVEALYYAIQDRGTFIDSYTSDVYDRTRGQWVRDIPRGYKGLINKEKAKIQAFTNLRRRIANERSRLQDLRSKEWGATHPVPRDQQITQNADGCVDSSSEENSNQPRQEE